MTRRADDTDATAGSAARALAERAVSIVDTGSRIGDPFVARPSVGQRLRWYRSRDPDTDPAAAIRHAIQSDWLVALPRPRSGRPCLTVRDGRRIAAAHARYRHADEPANVDACDALLGLGLPDVLDEPVVIGPP
jgi:hypothetical protein